MTKRKVRKLRNIKALVDSVRSDLLDKDIVLLYAHNGVGKTRLSTAFKDKAKRTGEPDTLYYNAFTEDLFSWDNDLEQDSRRALRISKSSRFTTALSEFPLDIRIQEKLSRYADFSFEISEQREYWEVVFSRGATQGIKISRGEENIFIWSYFLAVVQLVTDGTPSYEWVKRIYIDDPISSLDDHNVVTLACDIARLCKEVVPGFKVVVSTHHILFFNIMANELRTISSKKYYLTKTGETSYGLITTDDIPYYQHIAMLQDIDWAIKGSSVQPYHFNGLRTVMEKTQVFFGGDDFSQCIGDSTDRDLFARALNLYSHGGHSVFDPTLVARENVDLLGRIVAAFKTKYGFVSPDLERPVPRP